MSNATPIPEAKPVECFVGEPTRAKIGLLGAVSCLVLLDGVNGSVCSTLGSYLNGSFAATPDQITWAAIVYYVPKLYMLLLAARLQERFGQRWSLLRTSVVLVLATVGGAFVGSYHSLLIILFLQGAAGGLMIALGQGALLAAFPRREQALVQSIFALAAVMFPATIVPALLGDWAYKSDWQDAYLWMMPFGVLGCGWLFWKQKSLSNYTVSSPVAVIRIILMVTSLFAIVYVLQQGNRNAWLESPSIVWALLLAAACWLAIAVAESSGGPTYLRYAAFQNANFTFGLCISLLAGINFFGSGFLISGFATSVLSYPVSQSGFVQLSATAFATISLLLVGLALRFTKIPGVLFVLFGLVIFGIAMWHLGQAPSDIHFDGLVPWLTIRGFALGCQFLPLTLMTLTSLPAKDDVAAAGLFNFGRQFGALAGIAWMQTLHEHLTDRNQTVFGNALSWTDPNTVLFAQGAQNALSLHGTQPMQIQPAATALMLQDAHRQMASIAFNGCFQSLAVLFLFSFPLVVLARILTSRYLKH